MSSTPPGRYPDPSGQPGLRYFDGSGWTDPADAGVPGTAPPPRHGVPNWVWAAVAIALSFVAAFVVAVVVFKFGPAMPTGTEASSTTSAPPLRSALIPQLRLPAGTTQRDYQSFEHFDVPLSYADTVEVVRPSLPIGRAHDGLAWCTETDTGDDGTTWSWGNELDYLDVRVYPATQGGGSEIQVMREPNPAGCVP
jgi:Protein of unknown function (DUF2510)